jgi:RNA polymerase sigma-70 factor (ECF subfamily)
MFFPWTLAEVAPLQINPQNCFVTGAQVISSKLEKSDYHLLQLTNDNILNSLPDIRHVIDEYGDLVMTLCQRILADRELAEEAAQDTFVKAYRNLKDFRADASLKTWIYRIAYNTAIDYQRKKRRKVMPIDQMPLLETNADALHSMVDQEQILGVHQAIEKLPADQRALITLYYLEEKNIKEVSDITGWSESNVKIKLFRARKQLAEILTGIKKS